MISQDQSNQEAPLYKVALHSKWLAVSLVTILLMGSMVLLGTVLVLPANSTVAPSPSPSAGFSVLGTDTEQPVGAQSIAPTPLPAQPVEAAPPTPPPSILTPAPTPVIQPTPAPTATVTPSPSPTESPTPSPSPPESPKPSPSP